MPLIKPFLLILIVVLLGLSLNLVSSSRNNQQSGRGKGRGNGGAKQSQTQNSGGTSICHFVLSSKSIVVALASCDTNHSFVRGSNVEDVFRSHSIYTLCQICFHRGHSAVSCPSRYAQTSNDALVSPLHG